MGKKILVVDDDPVGSMLIANRLTRHGYEVLIEHNGLTALACVKSAHPDLILLDIEMPEMNGYTFIVEMHKDEAIKDIPVIVQTSHEENRAIFGRRGIKHYLLKPLDFEQLFVQIKELVGEQAL